MTTSEDFDRLFESIMCARCEARPGEPCVTVTGNRASMPHAARTDPIQQAFSMGYEEGDSDRGRLERLRKAVGT